ncbi:MAG: VWA domain-containing protein [Gammaproteobacteria bacterium]
MGELLDAFHFSEPVWLWALLLCIPVAIWLVLTRHLTRRNERLQQYADSHLMPHLLGRSEITVKKQWQRYAQWVLVWILLVLAMAGPRWDFTDVQLFRPGTNLVVLFDISRSMDVTDVQPTRLARAQQEMADLLDRSRGIRIGVIGFASIAHVVAPVTEDMNSIRRVLPVLSSDLVQLQGSRLTYALDRAGELLAGQPEKSVNSLLIITDGDFDEPQVTQKLQAFFKAGVRTHVLGFGTPEGGNVPGKNERWIMGRDGKPVVSALGEPLLKSMAAAGGGIYQRADYRQRDTERILGEVKAEALLDDDTDKRTRVWNERFYWLAGLASLLLLPLFRRTMPAHQVRKS